MTDISDLSDSEKVINADETIYADLITEIDLQDDVMTDKKDLNDLVDQNNESASTPTELPTGSDAYVSTDVLTQDDAVSDFFAVDSKADDFDNEMIIGELDSEGIDFKNETDVAECHHEYESKKLLFGDCEDIVEVVTSEVIVDAEEQQEVVEEATVSDDKIETTPEDPCFVIADDESLNRMHVMEDVEEGCDVSGALPSSPGHAEQRPDPPKTTAALTPTTESTVQTNTTGTPPPAQNGLPAEDVAKVTEKPKSPEESPGERTSLEPVQVAKESTALAEDTSESDKTTGKETEVDTKPTSPVVEESGKESQVKRENEEDSTSNDSSPESSQSNKRKLEDGESLTPTKRLRTQVQQEYPNHDRILTEYIENSGCGTVEELQAHAEQLLAEIRTLNELAREKEREWNNILHIKKVKEELLLRMQRKKQILLMSGSAADKLDGNEWSDVTGSEQDANERSKDGNKAAGSPNSSGLMMVPVVSSSPAGYVCSRPGPRDSVSKSDRLQSAKPRPILPKPTAASAVDLNGQSECRQGRQGPIVDVRSIIADYRQRHPETVPRRGRRLKSVLNTTQSDAATKLTNASGVLSMASLALGSGSQVRHGVAAAADVTNELGLLLSAMDSARQENSRPSSADSSVAGGLGAGDSAMSFKDVLVQFARLSQSERQELQAQAAASFAAAAAVNKPPPPPYPEVTLHPVPPVVTTATPAAATTTTQNNSLLHGILTKGQPRSESKPATFSPTLARLLTAPERVSNNNVQAMYTAALNSGVSINDLLSTGKSRNEITITPVGQYGQNMKHKDGDHVEEDETEDSADRLVIDEGGEGSASDRNRADNGSETGDEVPQCQGCHQKSAQFVCAGCGNQWYCSRDCQVAAWDEHSEVCSG